MRSKRTRTERTMADRIADFTGKPVAILCARYWYRGVVEEVGKDFVTLSNVRAVEVTGPAGGQRPATEDEVPSDMSISLWAVEQFCRPGWVAWELDSATAKPGEGVVKHLTEE
jgi:hypothetical protein